MTQRLASLAVDNWADIDGYAVSRGLGPLGELSIERFANFIWWWATHGAESKEKDKFRARLWQPPKGVVPEKGPWSAEEETKAFSALKKSLGK